MLDISEPDLLRPELDTYCWPAGTGVQIVPEAPGRHRVPVKRSHRILEADRTCTLPPLDLLNSAGKLARVYPSTSIEGSDDRRSWQPLEWGHAWWRIIEARP